MISKRFTVRGMTCAACQNHVSEAVGRLNGVSSVEVNLLSGQMKVDFDPAVIKTGDICSAVAEAGYSAEFVNDIRVEKSSEQEDSELNELSLRLKLSSLILVLLLYLSMGEMLALPGTDYFSAPHIASLVGFLEFILALAIIFINRKIFFRGYKALLNGHSNMDTLVALGSSASLLYSLWALGRLFFSLAQTPEYLYDLTWPNLRILTPVQIKHWITLRLWALESGFVGEYKNSAYFDSSAAILTFVTLGKYLEVRAKAKTYKTLEDLANLVPKVAFLWQDDKEIETDCADLKVGDVVCVKTGNIVPVDGIVVYGQGLLNLSSLTGESLPVLKSVGERVISGSVNCQGYFRFQVERAGKDTVWSQFVELVERAANSKAPITRLADKISAIFVPAVIALSLLTFCAWMIVGQDIGFAISRAVSVLVISCPCALGLAAPVAVMVGMGKAANMGLLIKNAESLEALSNADTVVLDKTGTITEGILQVKREFANFQDGCNYLDILLTLESGSVHPLAKAIVSYAKEKGGKLLDLEVFTEEPGHGIEAKIAGTLWRIGTLDHISSFLEKLEVDELSSVAENFENEGMMTVFLTSNLHDRAVIGITDSLRSDSSEAVSKLKDLGLKVIVLSGDRRNIAENLARIVGADEFLSEVLPLGKEDKIAKLQEEGHKVIMVGDGVNDAPALQRADVGLAMGMGTDLAIDCADGILLKNSLWGVVESIRLSRAVVANIKENLAWAFIYNLIGIPIAAGVLYTNLGLTFNPMLAALAMSLSSVCVVGNALCLNLFAAQKIERVEKSKNMQVTIYIEGMMCAHCQKHVQESLEVLNGVESVDVDLAKKCATVSLTGEIEDSVFTKAITDAGYAVTKIVR